MQLTPFASKGSRAVGASEATSLQSAAALALAEIFRNLHATGCNPLCADDPLQTPLSGLACSPVFTPVHAASEDAWNGVAYIGGSHVFFETQAAKLPRRAVLNAQDQLQVRFVTSCGTGSHAAAPRSVECPAWC